MAESKKDFLAVESCFGYHADIHLWMGEKGAGDHALPDELEESLLILKPDWVQVDSKGHPGVASFFSKVPDATVCDTLSHDAVAAWREATDRLNLPLICHYSGFLDISALRKHPEWRHTPAEDDGWKPEDNSWEKTIVCPRSDYWDRLVIPQLLELARDYHVDGFWTDGDAWSFRGCWCPKCCAEFTRRTGITDIPRKPGDPHHDEWWQFQFESVLETISRCSDAVHAEFPNIRFCSNWLDTVKYPLPERLSNMKLDWLSGDTPPNFPLDNSWLNLRTEMLWIANRGRNWDLMSWPTLGWPDFYPTPQDMLCQEAAHVVAAGGRYLFCEGGAGVRTSQQINWRLRRLAKVGDFVRERAPFCRGAAPVREVAILHSERAPFLTPNSIGRDLKSLIPSVDVLMGCQYNVDILDERMISPIIDDFKVVVLPQDLALEPAMAETLKRYVGQGGTLLACGTETIQSLGLDFFGITRMNVETKSPKAGIQWDIMNKKDDTPLYFVSDSSDGVFPVDSARWGLLEEIDTSISTPLEHIYDGYILENSEKVYPAAVMAKHGKGRAIALPCDFFGAYPKHHYLPEARKFIQRLMKALMPVRDIDVQAPSVIDVIFRKKDGRLLVHLLNRNSGSSTSGEKLAIDEIQPVGPVTVTFRLPKAPRKAELLPEKTPLDIIWNEQEKTAVVTIPAIHIHSALALEE